jgi:hypothetical protein
MTQRRPRQERRQESQEQKERNARFARLMAEDLAFLVQIPQFQRFALKLMEECRTFKSPFTGNGWTAFNCGKQSVGQNVFDQLLEVDDEFLTKARREWSQFLHKEGL